MGLFNKKNSSGNDDASVLNRRQVLAGLAGLGAVAVTGIGTGEAQAGRLDDDYIVEDFTDSISNPKVITKGDTALLYDGSKLVTVGTDCGPRAVQVLKATGITQFILVDLDDREYQNSKTVFNLTRGSWGAKAEADMTGQGTGLTYVFNSDKLGEKWAQNRVVDPNSQVLKILFNNTDDCKVVTSSPSKEQPPGSPPVSPPPPPPPSPPPEIPGGGCDGGPSC